MSAYIPYLVIVAVILVFFIICYFVFRESPKKAARSKAESNVQIIMSAVVAQVVEWLTRFMEQLIVRALDMTVIQ